MNRSAQVLVVGPSDALTMKLQQRLVKAGVACDPASIVPSSTAATLLTGLTDPPDVVFFHCGRLTAGEEMVLYRLRGQTTAAIVAFGTSTDARAILDVIRAGASDYLHDSDQFEQDLTGVLARISGRANATPQGGTVTAIVSASGGCGSSTVAVNLAAILAKRKLNSVLIDLKMIGGDLATILNLRPQHTILDVCQQAEVLDVEMLHKALTQHDCGLRLLAAPNTPGTPQTIREEQVTQIVGLATQTFPHVLVDLEDAFHREQLAVVRACRNLLVVMRLELPCIARTRRLLQHLEQEGIPPERIRLIANRVGQKFELPPRQVSEIFNRPITQCLPNAYELTALAANIGIPLIVDAPNSKLAASLEQLATTLWGG